MSSSLDSQQNSNVIQANHAHNNHAQQSNYTHWINTHLKKRPGVKLIENLQIDIINGVALIHLIEVISGHVLADVNLNPKSMLDCKENIEKVLKFMQNNSVKMTRTSSKEILEGNVKSIMRLILALAAHYKPTNLQPSSQRTTTSCSTLPPNKMPMGSNKNYAHSANNLQALQVSSQSSAQNNTKNSLNQTRTLDSMTHLVQAACVSIADVRRYGSGEKNFNVKYVKRNNLNCQTSMPPPLVPPQPMSPPISEETFISPAKPSKINNQTYTAQTTDYIKPVTRTQFSNESSFSFSPNSQKPLANSTILNCTTTAAHSHETIKHSLPKFDNYSDNKNITRIIEVRPEKAENPVSEIMKDGQIVEVKTSPTKLQEPLIASANCVDREFSKTANTLSQTTSDVTLSLVNESQIRNYTNENLEDVKNAKQILITLQNLLMSENFDGCQLEKSGTLTDEEIDQRNDYELSDLSPEEQIAILRSKIQQLEILCSDLKNELNQYNYLSMQKIGEGRGLKSRLNEQDNTILEMKTEQLNLHLKNEQFLQEIDEFKSLYQEQLNLTNSLKSELHARDELIEKFKQEISSKDKQQKYNKFNTSFTKSFNNRKENVLSEIANEDVCPSLKNNETFIIPRQKENNSPTKVSNNALLIAETDRIISESIDQVRRSFKSNQLALNLFDTLEKEVKSMSEKLVKDAISVKINPVESISNTISSKVSATTGSVSGSSSASISSSTSSSVTSSSANSPVLSINSMSSSTNASIPNIKQLTTSIAQQQRHFSKQISLQSQFPTLDKQLFNQQVNLKQSADNILNIDSQQMCGSYDGKMNKFNSHSKSNISLVNNEGHVKKIISRFQQVEQTAKFKNESKDSDDSQRSPNTTPTLSKFSICSEKTNKSECNSSGTLLAISSNSPTFNDQYSQPLHSTNSGVSQIHSTKCIYYLNKDTQPYCVTIFKKVDNILLHDFKENVKLDPSVNYRFFFKSQEPEFGYLKEEISNDKKKLPSYDNKIIAWIEAAH